MVTDGVVARARDEALRGIVFRRSDCHVSTTILELTSWARGTNPWLSSPPEGGTGQDRPSADRLIKFTIGHAYLDARATEDHSHWAVHTAQPPLPG